MKHELFYNDETKPDQRSYKIKFLNQEEINKQHQDLKSLDQEANKNIPVGGLRDNTRNELDGYRLDKSLFRKSFIRLKHGFFPSVEPCCFIFY